MKLIVFVVMTLFSALAAANEVLCDIEYASQVTPVKLAPVQDPYQLTNVDLRGDYRFTAQFLQATNKLKTFVYYQAKDRYVLIHAAEYAVAENNCAPAHNNFGLNRVYDSYLERELIFQCRLVCH